MKNNEFREPNFFKIKIIYFLIKDKKDKIVSSRYLTK